MVPGMFLFGFTPVQATFVATFVEIAGGVASDALFGRRLALLSSIDMERAIRYQWFGLCISSCVIGILFWLLISGFGIGTTHGLAVNKAASRALLLNIKNFDLYVLGMGCIFGYCMTYTGVSLALILGGIFMSPSASLLLIAGSLLAYCTLSKKSITRCGQVFLLQILFG